jgi:hypothetical protein
MMSSELLYVYCNEFECRGNFADGKVQLIIEGLEHDDDEEGPQLLDEVLQKTNIDHVLDWYGIEEVLESRYFKEEFVKEENNTIKFKMIDGIVMPLVHSCLKIKVDEQIIAEIVGYDMEKLPSRQRFKDYCRWDLRRYLIDKTILEVQEMKLKLEEAVMEGI